jgi:predicted phage tail protein
MTDKKQNQIIGAGGGRSQPPVQQTVVVQQAAAPAVRTPVRTADNLASTAFANILDLLSEGEIEGFPSARAYTRGTTNYNLALLKDVYLTDTPILRSGADVTNLTEADYNFKGVSIDARYGTNAQDYIPKFGETTEDVISVNTEVIQATPVTRQITDTNVDAVRVSIAIPRLEQGTAEGDILGTSVTISIQLQYNGGGFTTVKTDTISGRTADKYERDYLIDIAGAFPVDLRVVRDSADSTDTNVNPTFFVAYTELIYQKLRYPNSALAAVRFQAEQFNNIPARSYRIRGIKVKIPNNATVDSDTGRLTYAGTWTGTFGAAQWTTCPAWILYDLLISKRYGFGDHVAEAQLDKFAFYSASQYANELVDAGLGDGTKEARFSCNALIQNQYEAYKLINDLCSVMRCQPYWSTGTLTITQDKPTDSSYLFNRSNVLEPGFSYAGSDLKTRHTVAVVSYLDLNTREQNYEIVEDRDAIEKYGWVATEIKAFACTSRGQANRLGQWILFSEQNETEVISFTTSIEAGSLVRPGAVIDVQDPLRAGVRYGGRIIGAGTNTLSVDDATGLPTQDATLSVLLPDGSLETKTITGRTGTLITVNSNWSTLPQKNSVWIIQTSAIETQQYRVLTVKESEGNLYSITGLLYNSSKYAHVERGFQLSTRQITNLNPIPLPPTSPVASETFYEQNGKANVKIILSWAAVKGIPQYKVRYRAGNDNWEQLVVSKPDAEILDTRAATYVFEIYSINSLGRQSSDFASLTYAAIGKTAIPGNVQNLSFEAINANSGRLRWTLATDLDVRVGGKVLFRHSNLTDGTATWSNSVELIAAKNGNQTEAIIPLVEGEVLVKFEDDGGRQSASETSVIIDLPDTLAPLTLITRREDQDAPPFQGTRTNVFYSDEFDALTLDGADEFDDVPDLDDLAAFDVMGDVLASGTYEFATTVDFGNTFSVDFSRYFVTRGYFPNDLVDSRNGLVDDWDDWDGAVISNVNAELELRSTFDNPSGTPTWGTWQPFVNGTFRGRGFQFRTNLTSNNIAENILVDELGYLATIQRRTEQSIAPVSGSSSTAVVFTNPFFTGTASIGGVNSYLPSVGITAQNMQTGDYFQVSAVSGTGFTINFFDSSNSTVTRQFTWTATGYGRAG